MLKNYLKIAFRSLWNRKFYSALNISGLAIGLAVCMMIVFYVKHEFTYDDYHEKADRIVRITTRFETPDKPMTIASSPVLLASYLNKDYPEIEKTTRFEITDATVKSAGTLQRESDVYFAEQSVFDVFSFTFLNGTASGALSKPNSAVVTKSFSEKYFGKKDALGETISINKILYEITGVIADLPSNSDMKINVLLSREFVDTKEWLTDDFPVYTFALFKNKPNLSTFDKKLQILSQRYIQPELKAQGANEYKVIFETEALKDVHYSAGKMGDSPKGNKQYGYLFSFLALFVLVIAVLNYINLLTASATERSKEVCIRKANGAKRRQLIWQFLFESFIISFLSILLSAVIVKIATPALNNLLQIRIPINWTGILLVSGLGLLVITMLGGLYPSFVLSSFKPIQALKGTFSPNGQSVWLRKGITLFQFSLAFAMIFGVLVIRQQMTFLQNHNPGFDREQILSVSVPDDSVARSKINGLAAILRQESKIEDVTVGLVSFKADAAFPTGTTIFKVNGKKKEVMCSYFLIDENFIPTLNIRLLQGRNLSADNISDKNGGFIVNEAFVKMSGWANPIGQEVDGFMHKGKVIGVARNFNYKSLHNKVEPLLMVYNNFPPAGIMIKTKPENLSIIESAWKAHYPDYPFDYSFLDNAFEAQYRKDHVMMVLFNGFAFLTVLVSCLGLLSLITFSTRLRTKEIGIRKVLGSSVSGIVALLSKDYLLLVVLAFVIASPAGYYAMNKWLQTFAYRIDISWLDFAIAGFVTVATALFTISFQSIKAALMNPVKSLRSE
ncbi:ABC transporter permease [Dyadobacter sp. NIV53]|uniref:ABC transporter permease n=1 Tax=Dyadobacter sp. NIV53 TaxID=2861765 RepID=UPI001C87EFB7|nr:ABC transporter permease [Dyadobacter sp. NIV53]